jgi:hypothetical protein
MFTYAAEPGTRSAEALTLLGSWAATVDPTGAAAAPRAKPKRSRSRLA